MHFCHSPHGISARIKAAPLPSKNGASKPKLEVPKLLIPRPPLAAPPGEEFSFSTNEVGMSMKTNKSWAEEMATIGHSRRIHRDFADFPANLDSTSSL